MAIRSVAIIGAGPSGLTSLYELLHTEKNGESTVGGDVAKDPAFTKIQVYEQKSKAGGVWNVSLNATDPDVPSLESIKAGNYNDPFALHPPKRLPTELFSKGTVEQESIQGQYEQWSTSPVYEQLYSNVPQKYMNFSYLKPQEREEIPERPFLKHQEVQGLIEGFVKDYGLGKYIRFNTEVESVKFGEDTKKWTVVSRTTDEETSKDKWVLEKFDAVIVANGRYNIPYIPLIPGLNEFIVKYPGVVQHAKSFRSSESFRDKTVVVVGSSFTAINIIQYSFQIAKKFYISRKSEKSFFEYLDRAATSEGIIPKPQIEKFNDDGSITFADGTILKEFDHIVFATGYHFHVPFLDKDILTLSSKDHEGPSYNKSVQNIYLHTFSIKNPTLAFVGVPGTSTVWHTFESSAAGIAGVWSGATSLPSIEDQKAWIQKRLEASEDSRLFQSYPTDTLKEWFLDPLIALSAKGRQHPWGDNSVESISQEIKDSLVKSEELFYEYKEGRLS